ncbi:SMI1/KNR4 family protein [Shewanella sp. VB17]|uniref:SMI1/KNR4 family protein n=1 Tax=Shewanella sp. VB17 TaxID=2739432 RepID=UPI0015642181|nr:SMI1/KNR4 family protein [Shewanella sp. VB17]NRD71847.1 SMI1/KNR4 family protein [Shewanella sp. VB17]
MIEVTELITKIEQSGQDIFWLGKSSFEQIEKLEFLLGIKLPKSYKSFLLEFGGGGVVGAEISGIEDNNAELDYGGTTYGDTLVCREDYLLPDNLVVIFFRDDEICWCLDIQQTDSDKESSIVSYNLFNKKIDRVIADDFEKFFREYLDLRSKG